MRTDIEKTQETQLAGTIDLLERLGESQLIYVTLKDGSTITVRLEGDAELERGRAIHITLPAHRCHLFDQQGLTLSNKR